MAILILGDDCQCQTHHQTQLAVSPPMVSSLESEKSARVRGGGVIWRPNWRLQERGKKDRRVCRHCHIVLENQTFVNLPPIPER